MRTSSMIGTAHTMAAILAIGAFTVLSTSRANALDEKSQVAAAVSIPFDELVLKIFRSGGFLR